MGTRLICGANESNERRRPLPHLNPRGLILLSATIPTSSCGKNMFAIHVFIAAVLLIVHYNHVMFSRNLVRFDGMKKPSSWPSNRVFEMILIAYPILNTIAVVDAGWNGADYSAYVIFATLMMICTGVNYSVFERRRLLMATIGCCCHWVMELIAIAIYSRTSYLAAGLVAAHSLWSLYAIYVGYYMLMHNRPE